MNGEQGTAILEFTIEKDGSVTDVKVVKSVSPSIDAEAIRVVKLMKDWMPAKKDGKTVRSRMKLPVAFRLG